MRYSYTEWTPTGSKDPHMPSTAAFFRRIYSQPINKHALFVDIADITEELPEMGMEFLLVKEIRKYHKLSATTASIIR